MIQRSLGHGEKWRIEAMRKKHKNPKYCLERHTLQKGITEKENDSKRFTLSLMVEREKSGKKVRPLPTSDHCTLHQYGLCFFVSKVSILLSFSNTVFVVWKTETSIDVYPQFAVKKTNVLSRVSLLLKNP